MEPLEDINASISELENDIHAHLGVCQATLKSLGQIDVKPDMEPAEMMVAASCATNQSNTISAFLETAYLLQINAKRLAAHVQMVYELAYNEQLASDKMVKFVTRSYEERTAIAKMNVADLYRANNKATMLLSLIESLIFLLKERQRAYYSVQQTIQLAVRAVQAQMIMIGQTE